MYLREGSAGAAQQLKHAEKTRGKALFLNHFTKWPSPGLGQSHVEAFTGPTWRPWPVPHGGLHRSHVEALAPDRRGGLAGPTWRPSPVPCGGLGRSHVEAFIGPTSHAEAFTGPTWRPWPVPRGGLRPYVTGQGLHVGPVTASTWDRGLDP